MLLDYVSETHKNIQCADIPEKILKELECMGDYTLIILKKSFFVFSNQDLDKAKELPIDDDRIDEMYDSILNEVTENMIKNNELIPYFVDVIFLARYFERIADKSVSIGSRTIFMLTLRRPSIDD